MNAHAEIMKAHRSAYACAKATGIHYDTCKRWWRLGQFVNPRYWQVILEAVGCDQPEYYKALAKDY